MEVAGIFEKSRGSATKNNKLNELGINGNYIVNHSLQTVPN